MSREMLQNLTHFFEYKETAQVVYSLIWISNFLGFGIELLMYVRLKNSHCNKSKKKNGKKPILIFYSKYMATFEVFL